MSQIIKLANSIRPISGKINFILTLAVVFLIPFGTYVTKIAVFIWLLMGLIQFRWSNLVSNFKFDKLKLIFISLILFYFLLHIIGFFYSSDKLTALHEIGKSIYILLFLFVFLSSDVFDSKNYKTILSFFVLGNVIASLVCLFIAFYQSLSFVNGTLVFQGSIKEGYTFIDSISNYGNYFFYNDFSLFNHPSYSSIYIIFSIIILFFINKENKSESENFITRLISNRIISTFLILFLIVIVLLLSSKANFIALVVIILMILIITKFRFKFILISALSLLSIIFISHNPRFNSYLDNLNIEISDKNSQPDSENSRLYIWKTAFEVSQENILFGLGTGDGKHELIKMFEQNNMSLLKDRNYNTHNTYLEILISFGLLGLIPFLLIYFMGTIIALKERNYILLFFLILTAINFLFESMLSRVGGIIFWIFFIYLLSLRRNLNLIPSVNYRILLLSKLKENIGLFVFILPLIYYLFWIRHYADLYWNNQIISISWFKLQNFKFNDISGYPNLTEFIYGLILNFFPKPNFLWIKLLHIVELSLVNLLSFKILQTLFPEKIKIILLTVLSISFIPIINNSYLISNYNISIIFLLLGIYFLLRYLKSVNFKDIFQKGKILKSNVHSFLFLILALISFFETNGCDYSIFLSLNIENPIFNTGLIVWIISLFFTILYNKIKEFKTKNIFYYAILLSVIILSVVKKNNNVANNLSKQQLNSKFYSTPLIGVLDEFEKTENFDSLYEKLNNLNLSEYKYLTDIAILPYLLDVNGEIFYQKSGNSELNNFDYLILSKKYSSEIVTGNPNIYFKLTYTDGENSIFRNNKTNLWNQKTDWQLPQDGEQEALYYSFVTSEQGFYKVSAKLKFYANDSTINPRISIFAKYEDGTINAVEDYNIMKDNVERLFEISMQTDTSKKLIQIYGWILDHSNFIGKKHVDVNDIKITIE